MKTKKFGIYAWINLKTGRVLVGQTGWTVGFEERKKQYLRALRKNKYGKANPYFQNSWSKHKEENFEFVILQELTVISTEALTYWEQAWLDHYRDLPEGVYNRLGPVEAPRRGQKNRPEHTAAIVASRKGKPSILKGKKRPKEVGEKISATKKGMEITEKERERLKLIAPRGPANHNYGKPASAERKLAIALANGTQVVQICGLTGKKSFFVSIEASARASGISATAIKRRLKTGADFRGYYWKYINMEELDFKNLQLFNIPL